MVSDFPERYPSLYEQRLAPEVDEVFVRNVRVIDEFTRSHASDQIDRGDEQIVRLDLLPDSYRDLPAGMTAPEQDRFDINRLFTQKLRDSYGGGSIYTYDEEKYRTNTWEFTRWGKTFYVITENQKRDDTSLMPAEISVSSEKPAVFAAMEKANEMQEKPKYLFTPKDFKNRRVPKLLHFIQG